MYPLTELRSAKTSAHKKAAAAERVVRCLLASVWRAESGCVKPARDTTFVVDGILASERRRRRRRRRRWWWWRWFWGRHHARAARLRQRRQRAHRRGRRRWSRHRAGQEPEFILQANNQRFDASVHDALQRCNAPPIHNLARNLLGFYTINGNRSVHVFAVLRLKQVAPSFVYGANIMPAIKLIAIQRDGPLSVWWGGWWAKYRWQRRRAVQRDACPTCCTVSVLATTRPVPMTVF